MNCAFRYGNFYLNYEIKCAFSNELKNWRMKKKKKRKIGECGELL